MVLGFVLMAGSAQAVEWSYVESAGSSDAYIDRETIRRNGNTARAWSLADYARPQTELFGTFSSTRSLGEYDCAEQRSRGLQVHALAGNMARGEIVASVTPPGEWSYVAPGTMTEALMEAVCGR
jgi:hypothetical protein